MGWKSYGQQGLANGGHDVPKLIKIGKLGAGPGALWECRCGMTHEAKLTDGKLTWDLESNTAHWPNRVEVVKRMMTVLPTEAELKVSYPGDETVAAAFLVALHILERLNLAGDWLRD